MRRYGHGPCPSTASSADVTGDGCVDVRDVQAVAAAYTAPRPPAPDSTVPSHLFAPPSISGLDADVLSLAPGDITFTVNSTADDADANTADGVCATAAGVCTLRAALQWPTRTPAATASRFNIPGTGVQTINLASALPDLSDSSGGTEIDGYTQPGVEPEHRRRWPSNAGAADRHHGRRRCASSTRCSASRRRTTSSAASRSTSSWRKIWLAGPTPTTTVIAGNFIGTDPAATLRLVELRATPPTPASWSTTRRTTTGSARRRLAGRNVISGNQRSGVHLTARAPTRNIVRNNIVGLSPDGTRRLANVIHGLDVDQGDAEQHHRRHRPAPAQRPLGQQRRRHRGRPPHDAPSATRSSATSSAPT